MTQTLRASAPSTRPGRRDAAAVGLFSATAFVGAGLLFLVQPMVARLLLPLYGGSATVWSTSSLFFQVMLLAGYLYTDRTTSLLAPRTQQALHAVVLLAPLAFLPLALPADAAPPTDVSPVAWLLRTLLVVVGIPFLVLATTGPLVQRWYSWSDRPRAQDPYFLFAASNLGSFAGLLCYPFVVEPLLSLDAQLRLWSWLFVGFVALTGACLLATRATRETRAHLDRPAPVAPRPSRGRVMRWTAWSFLPSGLMLAVTAHVSTDIAAIPLLWVVPLSIYLATFVVAFARTTRTPPRAAIHVAVSLAFLGAVVGFVGLPLPVAGVIVLQMLMLAAVAFAAHARLAADRPDPSRLTTFYLVVAVGGALGGLLNGVVAPLVLDRVLEYSLLVAAVPLLMLGMRSDDGDDPAVLPRSARVGLLAGAAAVLVVSAAALPLLRESGLLLGLLLLVSCAAVAAVLPVYRLVSLAVVAAVAIAPLLVGGPNEIEHRRTFYGSYAVEATEETHKLRHGTTLHGLQYLDEERREVPTTYYAPTGPLGDVFELPDRRDVGVVGLGVGTIAAYGAPGQSMTFFEIDSEVVEMASDPELFTYLSDSEAELRTVVGDGRLRLAEEPARSLDLIVLDAFTSDAIPVHLLTQEALREYTTRLRPGGLIAVHISNRVFDLRPVLRGAADDLGWQAVVSVKSGDSPGATAATWVVLGEPGSLSGLTAQGEWDELPSRSVRWTDSFSSLLSVWGN